MRGGSGRGRSPAIPRRRRGAVHHHDPAAERDRQPAHGPCADLHGAGRAGPVAGACRGATCCGSRAPTMPASRRRWWWSGCWPPRARRAATLGREAFLERVWQWKAESGGTITTPVAPAGRLARLAARAVHHGCRAVGGGAGGVRHPVPRGADLSRPAAGELGSRSSSPRSPTWKWRPGRSRGICGTSAIRSRAWPDRFIIVATTRPETMLGDTAVAVHPEDPRWRELIGRHAMLPLVGRRIPIVADEHSDPDQGHRAR